MCISRAPQKVFDVIDSMSEGFFILDREWRFTYLNTQAALQFGATAESLTGEVIWDVVPSLRSSVFEVESRRAAREHISLSVVSEITDQSERFLEFRLIPSSSGIAAHSIDVTDQKRVSNVSEAPEAELRRLIDAAPAYISYVDTEYKYRVVNKAYETNFGYAVNSIIGRAMREVLGEDGWSAIRPYVERAMSRECVTFEKEATYPTLGTRWVRGTFTPDIDEDDRVRGVMICVVDITEFKRVQEALRKTAEELCHVNEVAPVGIWVSHDPSCEFISSNLYGQRLLNARPVENLSAGSASTETHGTRRPQVLRRSRARVVDSAAPDAAKCAWKL
jgi:PAS domain S-box-containing protein